MVTPEPATKAGLAVPVPPRTIGNSDVKPVTSESQEAASVPEVRIQVNVKVVLGVTVATNLPSDELIVKLPLELLWIVKKVQRIKVAATGSTTVCVVYPVKNCVEVLVEVNVVVPAAVTVVV